ncbi:hypothetical protein [Paenibacillus alkalitolerans]|uniref:hypothetical protein n=1 Tax=Paenibacillus alkalitolerans TaxID=2799335 RepID=UPI0018F3E5F8|nr:hypothetical protein [Paenibacillus alkalitolerans]
MQDQVIWVILSLIIGAFGGYLNTLLSSEGFLPPYIFEDENQRQRWSIGSWREVVLGAAAGFVSCVISIATSEPTIWTIVLYAILTGISGGSYLNKLAEKHTNTAIIDYNRRLDDMEKRLKEAGRNSEGKKE